MRVKFAYNKRGVLYSNQRMYAVVCQFRGGKWGLADFWGVPYVARNMKEARELMQNIIKLTKKSAPWWKESSFSIIKITF